MLITIQPTTLLQIFSDFSIDSNVIFKSIISADKKFQGILLVNPLILTATKSSQNILMKYCRRNVKWGKYFKDERFSEHYQQLNFKYLVESFLIAKLASKVT